MKSYKIKEVADMLGITAYTIRYYEKEGIIPQVNRSDSGIRAFSEDDLFWIDMVTCLKGTKMPVNDIKKIVVLASQGAETIKQRKEILLNHKSYINSQIEELELAKIKIDKKIAFYDGADDCDT